MTLQDYDDPELFYQSVSGITLKAMPEGFLSDCLGGSNLDITIIPSKKGVVGRGVKPWLDICELENISWSSNIRFAHLFSDHLEGSIGLFSMPEIVHLTVSIKGKDYHNIDVGVFHNAIVNSENLEKLVLIVEPEAMAQSQDIFYWPHQKKLTVKIETTKENRRRGLVRRRSGGA